MSNDKNKTIKDKIKKTFKVFLYITLALFITCCSIVGYGYVKYRDKIAETIKDGYKKVENVDATTFNSRKPTQIYDSQGNLIKEFKEVEYSYVGLNELNPYIAKAFVSTEDERFYEHRGVDYKGIMRAFLVAIKSGGKRVQGASTITQQLSKNVFLTMDRTVWRKLEEMVISQELEKKYSKDQILEFYVNNIYFGYGCYGVESASKYYFSKPTKDLSISEVAMISGITNNPSLYDPIRKPQNAKKRRNIILNNMKRFSMISEDEYQKAINEDITLNVARRVIDNSQGDYAISYAVYNSVRVLMEQEGFNFRYKFQDNDDRTKYFNYYQEMYENMEKKLLSGGFRIDTSIDYEKQNKLQSIIDEELSKYKAKDKTTGLYEKQASATTIDNETGEVVAIVGGRSQDGNTFNRAYLGARQPGSIIKPLLAYTPAFERGYIPESSFRDDYIEKGPKNYNHSYKGSVSLRYAVETSINTIPFRLVSQIGADKALQYLANMEFRYLTPTDNNPIIAIGGFARGATTVEMASGYSTIGRNGEFIRPTNVRKITSITSNKVIYENKYDKIKIYDSGASYLMTDTLKGVLSKSHGTGYKIRMKNFEYQAGKTGTTDQSKDAWFSGYTPYYTTTVWVGDDTPKPQNMYGSGEPGQIWKKFMEYLHSGLEKKDFIKPDSVIEQKGKLINILSLEEKKLEERKDMEYKRKQNENREQEARLKEEDYRILHGLTKEEETEREQIAESTIQLLKKFKLENKSQYGYVDKLIADAKKSLENVKRQSAYVKLKNEMYSAINKINSAKAILEKPTVIPDTPLVEPQKVEIPNNSSQEEQKPIGENDKPNDGTK